MSKPGRDHVDPELLALFADDPESLAVINAIRQTQKRPAVRRGKPIVVVAVAAVVITAIAFAALTRDESHAGAIKHALGVLPVNRVIHVTMEDERSAVTLVNLQTGAREQKRHILDEWFDPQTGAHRVRDRVGNSVISDTSTPSRASTSSHVSLRALPAAATFVIVYRRSLAHASDKIVTQREHGAGVYWLHFNNSGALVAVAINARTYKPTLIIFRDAGTERRFRVLATNILQHDSPIPPALPGRTPAITARIASTVQLPPQSRAARSALPTLQMPVHGMHPVLFRRVIFDDKTRGAELVLAKVPARGHLPRPFIQVQAAQMPRRAFGWAPSIVLLTRAQELVMIRAGAYWTAYLHTRGSFVRILTSEGVGTAVTVARRLGQ